MTCHRDGVLEPRQCIFTLALEVGFYKIESMLPSEITS